MKKIILLFAAILPGFAGLAQKPLKGNKGFTFGVMGIDSIVLTTANNGTGTLSFKYLIRDDLAARAGVFFGNSKFSTESDTTNLGVLYSVTTKSTSMGISLGISKSFGSSPKLDPYVGADVWYGFLNGSLDSVKKIVNKKGGGPEGMYYRTQVSDAGKGYKFGIKAVAGFNYFFSEHFAAGGEFGYGFSTASTGNGKTTMTKYDPSVNPPTTVTTGYNSATVKSSGFGTQGGGLICLSVFF